MKKHFIAVFESVFNCLLPQVMAATSHRANDSIYKYSLIGKNIYPGNSKFYFQ